MDDNTRVAKEKTFWDKLSPEYGRFIAPPMVKKAEERKEAAKLKNENKEDIEWLHITEGICKSVPVMYSDNSVGPNAVTDRVQVHSWPIHVNSLENIVKQVVEEVTKRKAYVVTEGTADYILNL